MRMFPQYFFRICGIIFLCSSSNAFAIYKGESLVSGNAWFIGAGGGVYWAKLQDSSTSVSNGSLVPAPFDQDLYTIDNPSANAIFQVNAGYRWQLNQLFIPYTSIYFQYRHYNNSQVTGDIYQYSLPDFLNYDYNFSYSADLFTLNGKIDLFNINHVMPYLSGGIGTIVNRLEDYRENPTINVTPRVSPAFATSSTSRFAATLGAGIDYTLTQNVWLTLGYDHVFQTNLPGAAGTNTWAGTSLNLGSTKLDTVFLNISAKFPDTFRSNS